MIDMRFIYIKQEGSVQDIHTNPDFGGPLQNVSTKFPSNSGSPDAPPEVMPGRPPPPPATLMHELIMANLIRLMSIIGIFHTPLTPTHKTVWIVSTHIWNNDILYQG